ncbi:hypothetical protein Lal_00048117, partial [Lupinus albus]
MIKEFTVLSDQASFPSVIIFHVDLNRGVLFSDQLHMWVVVVMQIGVMMNLVDQFSVVTKDPLLTVFPTIRSVYFFYITLDLYPLSHWNYLEYKFCFSLLTNVVKTVPASSTGKPVNRTPNRY